MSDVGCHDSRYCYTEGAGLSAICLKDSAYLEQMYEANDP
jgi:hypothetical protein